MSKRIYSLKREKSAEFPLFDGSAWFKEVSNQEFGTLVTNGQVRHSNGRFFATSSFAEAKAAAEGLDPTDYSYDDPETPPSPESRERSGGGIYPNPGATLKGIATLICVLGMVASVILSVVFGYSTSLLGDFNFGLFFGILIGGGILSYLSGLGLAAFGDLVLSANEIKRKLK